MDFHGPIEYGKSGGEATEKRESSAVVDDHALGNLTPIRASFGFGLRKRVRWAAGPGRPYAKSQAMGGEKA
jgi:hypothetical protein